MPSIEIVARVVLCLAVIGWPETHEVVGSFSVYEDQIDAIGPIDADANWPKDLTSLATELGCRPERLMMIPDSVDRFDYAFSGKIIRRHRWLNAR